MRTIPAMWMLVAIGSVSGLAETSLIAKRARSGAHEEMSRLNTTRDLAAQIVAARAASPPAAARPRPTESLATGVSAALEAAGLSTAALSGLSPEVAERVPGAADLSGLRHRRASLVLESVSLRQLGLFLGAWREREPAWTVTGIDVGPERAGDTSPGEDLPLRALVRLEALYFDDVRGAHQ